ncbi:hypothetical protein FGE12_16740 [Aggregicoccus sp. 17bor-14]|uniref:hypothetical protein n=1 Tax=Myxococcaceae TaxID=31 RepID=UPI00129CE19F|nr:MULTISPECIES: hypothetical protein [Myxococcaceae]MBF5044048.1 hypothetical protein [Simulacricoccus sp. 17bor-14]MRI89799.1 hypothetical protein [Aggregicoccus sp. 17bor-14]
MRTSPLLLLAAVCALSLSACKNTNDTPPPPTQTDGGNNPDAGDAGSDAGSDAGGDAGQVVLDDGGTVSVPVCKSTGSACTANADCCTRSCVNGACQNTANGGLCKPLGDSCGAGTDCCSTNCIGSKCVAADPACRTTNDVCLKNADCCSGQCTRNDGTAGACIATTGGTSCGVGGTPCTSGNNCCSKVCADTGTGVEACQRVSGCQVAGDYCNADSACCGGIPNGSVDCGNTNNRCDNGQACRAPGTICGKPLDASGNPVLLPDGGTFTVNNETNCCNGIKVAGGYDRTCRLDQVGVPRCFGCPPQYVDAQGNCKPPNGTCPNGLDGTANCCLPAGNVCDFADQCCNGAACVPDATTGVRHCAAALTCKAVGTSCNPAVSGECCAGTSCLENGELSYACKVPSTGGGSGSDAGTPDAGSVCKANGTTCGSSTECCSSVCTNGTCQQPPQCQPQAAACTTSGDCCTGLSCNIPAGATSGTCQLGATCSSAGQTCSPTLGCCSGLACLDSAGANCSGTTGACACHYTIQ